ncbi:hypothetical protein GIB67_011444 [Kingdonia uniflora]|uniref:Uncharacterized protein n=1 Tax=Kingdonia uniflora TaxID=39325 RepID=A0A7J7NLG3_9MAGN|nr:hypothetical protein GIB67_011444 [Kingdonia uniflora]
MASISVCAKVDEADLVGHLSPVIRVGDEEDTVAKLIEWPRLKGSRVKYPTGSSRFREFCKAKSSIDGIWGHTYAYREKKCRRLGDEVSLEYIQGVVKDSRTDGFYCYLAQFEYGLTLPLSNLAKSVINLIGVCPAQLNCNFLEVIFVCETLNGRWAASGSEKRITAKDFLEYYAVKYVTITNGAYLCSSFVRPCFFDLSSAGRVWNDNLLWVSGECLQRSDEEPLELNNKTITKGINYKMSRKESFIDVVAKEGTELEAVLKELEIMDKATVSNTVVRNLAKRKAVKRGVAPHSVSSVSVDDSSKRKKVISPTKSQEMLEESDKIAEGVDLRPRFEVEADLLEEQCRAKAREKMVVVMDDEFKKFARALKEVQFGSHDSLAGKLYQLRYTKAEITTFSEGNYEKMEIMDEEEVEEREGGLNIVERTDADNQETNQEIENSRLRVVDLEGLLEVEKKSSVELQLEGVCTTGLSICFCQPVSPLEEYEALISQYEDRLDDNVKLSLKLEEAKRQVEEKTVTILSRDLTLNQLTSELAELKEKLRQADLRRLKGKEAQSRDDLVEIQAKNQNLVDDLAHARGNVRRAMQCEKEMNERINQLCARISESKPELRVRELKYHKDLKLVLDKRDCEIASGEGSREMKEFLCRKEELVENMRVDLANSRQKSIDHTRQMSECIDQLTAELAESKARH